MRTQDSAGQESYTAFCQGTKIAAGKLADVVKATKSRMDAQAPAAVLIFDDRTGIQTDVDLNGPLELILKHLPGAPESADKAPPRPGRPKLGVVPREVTLMPRHWEWLNAQPGGASVTLRRLIDEACRLDTHRHKRAQEASYRFMVSAAGDLPGFEAATRALFAGDEKSFAEAMKAWPVDLSDYARKLARMD